MKVITTTLFLVSISSVAIAAEPISSADKSQTQVTHTPTVQNARHEKRWQGIGHSKTEE